MFLDRDGTINVKPPAGEYVTTPGQLGLLPGAVAAVRRLNEAGVWVAVATNQRGIARGKMTHRDLEAVHARLRDELARGGAHVDAVYYCPHEDGACTCRKPAPGLLLSAQREHPDLDFATSAMIGDNESDVQAGRRLGTTTVLLRAAADDPGHADGGADHVADTLLDAVDWLERTHGLG